MPLFPAAMQFVDEKQWTAFIRCPVGEVAVLQLVPFQRRMVPLAPTAQPSVALIRYTP